jgi:hypothetical protein
VRLLILGQWSHGGFGKVTQELGSRFLAAGVDVRILAVDHRGEPVTGPLAGRVWPASMLGGSHGAHISYNAITAPLWTKLDATDNWKPDAVLAIADMSGLLGPSARRSRRGARSRSTTTARSRATTSRPTWKACGRWSSPVAMSDYGRRSSRQFVGRPVPMIYHGVDTETFRPASLGEPIIADEGRISTKEACKLHFGLDHPTSVILRSDRPRRPQVLRPLHHGDGPGPAAARPTPTSSSH